MKTQVLILVSLLSLGAAGFGLLSCSRTGGGAQDAAVQYHCPMHPTVIADKPGSCRICGMDLVPIKPAIEDVEEDAAGSTGKHTGHGSESKTKSEIIKKADPHADHRKVEGYAKIKINPERQQMIGIRLDRAEPRALQKQIRVVGEVAHDPEMYQAQAEYLRTGGYSGDTGLRDSSRLKLEHMGMSPEQIRRLERRGRAHRNLIVSGKDPRYWVYAYFYESDLPYIRIGQPVKIVVPTLDQATFIGQLAALRSHIDTRTRSIRGIVEVKDPQLRLRPGLFVNAQVEVALPESLVVPMSAVLDSGERQIVFVKKGAGTFEPRQVELGGIAEDFVQIKSGVSEGEDVVIGANFMLDSESRLRAVIESVQHPASAGRGSPDKPDQAPAGHQH